MIDDLGYGHDGSLHVSASFGYLQQANIPHALRLVIDASPELARDLEDTSYFVSTIEVTAGNGSGMATWRKRLFATTSQLTADAAEYFGLPRERTVIMGSRISV